MSFIVEAVVSASIDVLFEKLASSDLLQFARQEQIHADLEKWEKTLVKIQAVLDDAEEKQTSNKLVEIWLGELKHLAYDIEDILDEFATEALRRKLLKEPQARTSKVHKFLPTCCIGLNPRSLKLNSTMASQIEEINNRLKKIVAEKEAFDLNINSRARSNQARCQRPPTTSLNESHIYGRDDDKEAILELLLKDEGADANFSVISIQGMGGLGKTTLAQLVYNDARAKGHFKITAWTCVSDDFNVKHLTKTILQSIDPETGDINDLNMLQVKLKEKLSGKKFLIVLDDVWDESYDNWTKLCLPFEAGSSGSKIIVTTRHNGVSSMVGALPAYQLKELPNNDCLSIFTYHALGKINFNEHPDLKGIGEKIVRRCKGLPLAAKTLGGLLRGKSNSKDWNEVLKCNIWNLSEEKSGIIPALRVSYYYLPSHLKRCFAYCSIFPKDYEFCKKELILLWMAEGFLQTQSSEKVIEDLGEEYFDDLHSRSFFQQLCNYTSMFVMHDLINDLAQWASKDICLRIDNLQEGEKPWKIPKNLRHLSYSNSGCIQKFEMKSLRTLLTLPPSYGEACDFPSALLQLRGLKVLSLEGYCISTVPEEIGDLKLLRHCNLSSTGIKFLPDSINKLYNLEALILKYCVSLERLCLDMGNLIKLRYLFISHAKLIRLEGMPLRIGRLTGLLRTPQHLEVELNGQEGFTDLRLELTCCNDESNEKQCQKLRRLKIGGYSGKQFPKWPEDTAFSGLVSLTFDNCTNCTLLPSMGQLPSLKKLRIWNLPELKRLGSEFYGFGNSMPFQSLEQLEIGCLQEWTEWIPYKSDRNLEAFPCLQQLSISNCRKLQGKLPEHLPSLESLSITECERWMVSVPVLPKHCNIKIDTCKAVVLESIRDCSSLIWMVRLLSGISREIIIAEGVAEGFSKVGKLDIVEYIEPTYFLKREIHSIQEFKKTRPAYFEQTAWFQLKEEIEELQQQELPGRCQYLLLPDCECAVKLKQALQSLNFLRGIYIRASRNLKFFPEVALPSQLRFILITGWNEIQSLPKPWMHSSNTSLQTLILCDSHGLSSIGRVQLLPNLKRLEIMRCFNLVTVLDEEEVPGSCSNSFRLECLENESCPSQSKSSDLQDSDKEIKLSCCSNHASVVSRGTPPMALKSLYIEDCPELVSVAKNFHNKMSLEELTLINCQELETLPSGMNNLTSLQSLVINACPVASIPEGGFPTSLTSLVIANTDIHKSLFEWGLHRLTSLKLLRIDNCEDVISFPQDETRIILPTSLIALRIEEFPKLERLSSIAQNLPCLEYLGLFSCLKLECLLDDGLPRSLKRLEIKRCPRLKESCEVGEPGYRPMIPQISDNTIGHFSGDFVEPSGISRSMQRNVQSWLRSSCGCLSRLAQVKFS